MNYPISKEINRDNVTVVKVKKLYHDSKLPRYAHVKETESGIIPEDACLDVFCHHVVLDRETHNFVVHTGIAVEYTRNKVFIGVPRSSLTKTNFVMQNSPGIIDIGYRGEILFKFKPINKTYKDYINYVEKGTADDFIISVLCPFFKGDAIGQFTIIDNYNVEIEEVTELSDSIRGTGGYGSSDEKK